jgi:hypothetical protein
MFRVSSHWPEIPGQIIPAIGGVIAEAIRDHPDWWLEEARCTECSSQSGTAGAGEIIGN